MPIKAYRRKENRPDVDAVKVEFSEQGLRDLCRFLRNSEREGRLHVMLTGTRRLAISLAGSRVIAYAGDFVVRKYPSGNFRVIPAAKMEAEYTLLEAPAEVESGL